MAKRFTDTGKWAKGSFSELSIKMKLVWIYLCDNCDYAGVWDINVKLLGFQIGEVVTLKEIEDSFKEKILVRENKAIIPSFVEFQYGKLRDNNSVHASVLSKLKKLDIHIVPQSGLSDEPSAVMARLSQKKKLEILALDYFKCTYCGQPGDEHSLVVDHIVPRNNGGQNDDHNLTTACVSCNGRKTDKHVETFLTKHSLHEKISISLRDKIDHLRTLNGAFKLLQGAKDKEEDKDKDKDKVKEKDKDKSSKFDFAALYKKYPRKEGKDKGLATLRATVKTEEEYQNVSGAIDRYIQFIIKERREKKFILLFSTFMNNISTWQDEDAGTLTLPKSKPIYLSTPKQPDKEVRTMDPQELRSLIRSVAKPVDSNEQGPGAA